MLKKFLAAASIAAMLAGPASAQFVASPLQNGVPTGPSVTGQDQTSGVYFGTGRVGVAKHLESGVPASGDVPVLSSCGGAVAGDAGSTDTAGTVTQGGTVTTCTITFGTAFTAAPACIVSDLTATRASMASTATTTAITVTGITASDKLAWICIAKSGG